MENQMGHAFKELFNILSNDLRTMASALKFYKNGAA